MANEQSKYIFKGFVESGALAPSQATRTSFTPGKVSSGDKNKGVEWAGLENENWNHDFLAVNGVNTKDYYFERTIKVGRRMVNDQVPKAPQSVSAEAFSPAAVDSLIFAEQTTGGDWLKATSDLLELYVVLTTQETNPTSTSPLTVVATFPRPVFGMAELGCLDVTNGTVAGWDGGDVTQQVFTYTITPTATGEVKIYVIAGVASDTVAPGGITNNESNLISLNYVAPAP